MAYNWVCEKCGNHQEEESREYAWRPEFSSVCEDCYVELAAEPDVD